MDFKNHIQNKYQREINPEFTNSAWHSFLEYRQKKKRRPLLFLWITAGSVLVVTIVSFLVPYNKYSEQSIPGLRKSAETTEIQKLNSALETLNNPVLKSKSHSELNTKNNIPPSKRTSDKLLKSNHTITSSRTNNNNSIDHKEIRKEDLLSNLKSTSQTINQIVPVISQVEFLPPVPAVELNTGRKVPISDYVNQQSNRIGPDKYGWNKSTFAGQLYGGLAFPSDVQTVEEKAFQVGAKFYFNTGRKIRLKTGLELGSISFISKMMNPQLGVDFIEAPSNNVRFDHAIVESISINLDLGIDFLLFSSKNWEAYAGLSYQLSKEIVKDIDYSFEGNDDLSSSDDILIAKKNSEKYFVPHILKLESGIRYKTPVGGINLSFTYPYQLSETNIDLLRQFQLNVGFIQRL